MILSDTHRKHTPNPSQEGKTTRITIIPAEQTYPLRLAVLWKHKNSLDECKLDIDDLPTTFHIGAFEARKVVAIATFLKQHNNFFNSKNQYRLRALATDSKFRGKGFGEKIVSFAIDELKQKNIDLLWCDAREAALGFYEKIGFTIIGEYYNVRNIGPHKLAFLRL